MDTINNNQINILWITDALMPQAAQKLGIKSAHAVSWIDSMSNRLSKNDKVKIAIASRSSSFTSTQELKIDNILYYVLPSDSGKKDYWNDIIKRFSPDIVHIYGTESDMGLMWLKYHQNIPTIVSLQGIISEYIRHYYGGIDFMTMVRFTTIRDLLRPSGFFSGRKKMIKNSKKEIEQLLLAQNVEGRSTWDRVGALKINPSLNYYYCPRLIRTPFYEVQWDIEKVNRYSIFVHQGHYPIKGLHFVLEALSLLKNKYPEVRLYIAGDNVFNPNITFGKYFPMGYTKYLRHLVKRLNVEDNIEFLGRMNAQDVAVRLSCSHVAVIPSAIENAPNSLAEAELVGTPVIASFVGGNMDMLTHNVDGFLYCFNEPGMLADYISRIFDDDEMAIKMSKSAHLTASKRHNPESLEKTLLSIYQQLMEKKAF